MEIPKILNPSEANNINDQFILRGVQRLAELSRENYNLPFKAHSKNALAKFAEASLEKKAAIEKQIAVLEKIISREESELPEREKYEEWPLIEKALGLYGLRLQDDFQSILKKDDVVEIYNSDHIQIFRTFNFYEYSAYSYLDLLMNEWYHLWERPSSILGSLMDLWVEINSGQKRGIVPMNEIPEHVYKEIYNASDVENFEIRSVLCKFGHVAPLYKAGGEIGGFIISCQVRVLAYGEETKSLSFI
jgi:hypothetical protein